MADKTWSELLSDMQHDLWNDDSLNGINNSLKAHIVTQAHKAWQTQRMYDKTPPVCNIILKRKNPSLSNKPYLDNQTITTTIEDVPVLVKAVRYRNQYGKYIVDTNQVYFIFKGDTTDPESEVFFTKDAIIEYNSIRWAIESIVFDVNSMLTQIEGTLIGGGSGFAGVT